MEFVRGRSLTDWVVQRGGLGWPAVRKMALDLISAVRAMHDAGQRHRDIKPDNVRVEEGSERLVLVDFGVVANPEGAEGDSLTASHLFLGTIRWSAPEWVYRDPPEAAGSPAIDVYGVGATLYYLITGTELFAGLHNRARLEDAVKSQAVRFRPNGFPGSVQTVLDATLSKKPEHRPSIEQLYETLATAPDDASSPAARVRLDIQSVFGGDEGRLAKQRADQEQRRREEFAQATSDLLEAWSLAIRNDPISAVAGLQWSPVGWRHLVFPRAQSDWLTEGSPTGRAEFTGIIPLRGTTFTGGAVGICFSGEPSSAQARRVFGLSAWTNEEMKVMVLPETIRRWNGTLDEVRRDALADIDASMQEFVDLVLANNESQREPPPPLTALGLSPNAARLAEYLVRHSNNGTSTDPLVSAEQIRQVMMIPDEDIRLAAGDLATHGLVERQPSLGSEKLGFAAIWPTPELFIRSDKILMGWDTEADARIIAEIVDAENHVGARTLADRLGWTPRRLNPALMFMEARGLVKGAASGDRTFKFFAVRRTDQTRSFIVG
jgi:hypothetical protein